MKGMVRRARLDVPAGEAERGVRPVAEAEPDREVEHPSTSAISTTARGTADESEPTRGAPPAPEEARAAIEAELRRSHVPGCSIAVMGADAIHWADGFGLADIGSGRKATPNTVYHLFSGTKLFTATAVVQLSDEGRFSLNDRIADHLPEARYLGGVTIRHLLSHTSGLKDSLRAFLSATLPPDPVPTAEEALRAYRLVAARPPGTAVQYRNVNYALLGVLVTRTSGLEYRRYVRERVLAPCGADCDFELREAWRPRAATGYINWWDPMRLVLRATHPDLSRRLYRSRFGRHLALSDYNPNASAIGGLVGTVPAFAAFLRAHLAADGRLLPAEALTRMRTLVAHGAAGIESRVGTGLGWKIGIVDGRTFVNHEGGGPGFTSELRIYPDEGLGVALAMNTMRMPSTMRVAHRIAEIVRRSSGV